MPHASCPYLYRAPLLPPEVRATLPPWRSSMDEADPKASVKLFLPGTHWVWYIVEYDGTDVCFGLAIHGHEEASNFFSLSRLAKAESPFGDWVERDEAFQPLPLSQLRRLHGIVTEAVEAAAAVPREPEP